MADDFDWSPYLEDGEEVLWRGRPRRGWFSGGLYQGALLVVTCLATFVSLLDLATGREPVTGVFGFFILFWTFSLLLERSARRKRAFAVTNRRALQITANIILAETRFGADTKATLLSKRFLRVFKSDVGPLPYGITIEIKSYFHKPKAGDVLIGLIPDATEAFRIAAAQIRAAREREAGDGSA